MSFGHKYFDIYRKQNHKKLPSFHLKMSINNVLWNEISVDFRAAVAILPNKLQVPCVECRNCSLRILSPNRSRITKHRVACPNRFQFKYIYPAKSGERLTVKCLLCLEVINSTAMAILMCHRQRCMPPQPSPPGPEPQIYYLSTDELFNSGDINVQMDERNSNEEPTQMEAINEITVRTENANELVSTVTSSSSSSSSTQSKGNTSSKIRVYPSEFIRESSKFEFKIVHVREENGTIRRCMQCLICLRIVKTVTMARVKTHRNVCFRKTLVTAMTTPHERDANNGDGEIEAIKQCFICDVSVEIHTNSDKRDHVNLYNTNTSHSDTPIYDLVWKFLQEKPSKRNMTASEADSKWNLVCLNCFQNIEDYDFAMSETNRLEKVLMEKLATTEKTYEERNNVTEYEQQTVETDDDAEMVEMAEMAEMTEMAEANDDIEIIEADEIVELIISDDECDEIEGNPAAQETTTQSPQTVVPMPQTVAQSPQTVVEPPQPMKNEKETDVIIDLDSDDCQSETESGEDVQLVEHDYPDQLITTDERVLTFNEL